MKIIWGISGSFCNHKEILNQIQIMINHHHEIKILVSEATAKLDTRFGTANEFMSELERISGNKVMKTLQEAETLGPKCNVEGMIIAPATSTFISKLAYGIYDSPCTLGAKAILRNEKPVILAIASNDILGNTAEALFKLKQTKNIYLVPFFQDDPYHKANSCLSKWSCIEKTMDEALNHHQIQPLFYRKEEDYE